MKLVKLEIEGFKSFAKRTEFCFHDGITGLIGPNGCGKSNVVDAFKWALGDRSAKSLRGEEMLDVIFNGSNGTPSASYAEVSLTFSNLNDENNHYSEPIVLPCPAIGETKEETASEINNATQTSIESEQTPQYNIGGQDEKLSSSLPASRRLPIDYDEVTVTRRLYRSGESEYLINNQIVRLKDIRELFMDTGVGMESYSIVEQGKIDFILLSNSKERRGLFEEAAGISKYKAKKRETESKLERVTQDLLRLNDIISEVKRGIRSIKIQATKAAKYRQWLNELKEKKTHLALHHYQELISQSDDLTVKLAEFKAREQVLTEKLTALEESITGIDQELLSFDNNLKRYQDNLLTVNAEAAATGQEIENSRQRRNEYQEEITRLKQNLGLTTQKAIETRLQLCETMQTLETAKNDISTLTQTLEEKNTTFKEVSQELETLNQELESKRNAVLNTAHKKSQYQNEQTSLQVELKNLSARRDKTEIRIVEITSEMLASKEQALRVEQENQAITEKNASLKTELHRQEDTFKSLKTELTAFTEEISRHKEEIHKKISRKEILEDLENHQAGLAGGVKAVLDQLKTNPHQFGKVYGILADLIDVEPAYIGAVESVLKDLSQAIITQTLSDSLRVLEFVKNNSYGRVTTISLETILHQGDPDSSDGSNQEINKTTDVSPILLKRLDRLVKTEPEGTASSEPHLQPLIKFLLSPYLIAENLDMARQMMLSQVRGVFQPIVALTGEVISARGVISTGTSPDKIGSGEAERSPDFHRGEPGVNLIFRKSELKRISEELISLQNALTGRETHQGQKTREAAELENITQSLRYQIYDHKSLELEKQRQKEEIQQKINILIKEKEIIQLELNEITGQINALGERNSSISLMLQEIETVQDQINDEIEQLNRKISRYAEENKALDQQITELKVKQAQARSLKEHLEITITQLNNQISHFETTLNDLVQSISELKNKISSLETMLQEKESALKNLSAEQTQLQEKINALSGESNRLKTLSQNAKIEINNCRQTKQQVINEVNEITLREKEISLRLGHLEEKHLEDTGIQLKEAYQQQLSGMPETALPSGHATGEPPTVPDNLPAPPLAGQENGATPLGGTSPASPASPSEAGRADEINWEELSRQIEEIKTKVGSMTDINLASIDQLKELEERFNFLSVQETDLNKSKESLQELIRKLNRASREMFQATFEKVQGHFNVLFRKLFGGGKAQLVLENQTENDILEAGVEIIAKPPGKEPSSISLLSGGEKTLTAIALIMSIFQLNPSPFCILDEADATLDETNVDRFVALIKQFSQTSQFIIITHNKKTMLVADILYGITMQTAGVSKKISVRLGRTTDEPVLAAN